MSRKNKNKYVSPIYAMALLWLFWPLVLPLFTLLHYLPLIVSSAVLYKIVTKIAGRKEDKKQQPSQQVAKPVEKQEEKSTGKPRVDKLIKDRDNAIREMRRLNTNIENEKISRQINDMEYTTTKIFDHVIANPDKADQISKFLNYYLPTTIKLLNTYDKMNDRGIRGENISATMKKVEDTLDMIVVAFHKQLDTLFAGEALDITSDITVMENLMKTEGLAQDENSTINLTLSEQ